MGCLYSMNLQIIHWIWVQDTVGWLVWVLKPGSFCSIDLRSLRHRVLLWDWVLVKQLHTIMTHLGSSIPKDVIDKLLKDNEKNLESHKAKMDFRKQVTSHLQLWWSESIGKMSSTEISKYVNPVFWAPFLSLSSLSFWFIENIFHSHTIHPNHNFPRFLHLLSPSDSPPLLFIIQKLAGHRVDSQTWQNKIQ